MTEPGSHPGRASVQWTPVQPGARLGGRYTIEREIGRGGMAVVYRAATTIGTRVAIKTPHADALSDPHRCERFLVEARALARLHGAPHVVQVFEKHEGSVGTPPYLVMEHLVGRDLARELRDGPLALQVAVRIALQVCDALADAHANAVVHRDVKPSNIFLARDRDGNCSVKVLDLGVARVPRPDLPPLTGTGSFVGSPAYAAPEHLESARSADERSDVWSLGVTLYEMLTGTRPIDGTSRKDVAAAVRERAIVPPSKLRPDLLLGLDDIVLGCLEMDPEIRPSIARLARDLSRFGTNDMEPIVQRIERRFREEAADAHAPMTEGSPDAARDLRTPSSTGRLASTRSISPDEARHRSASTTRDRDLVLSVALGLVAGIATISLAVALPRGNPHDDAAEPTPNFPAAATSVSCVLAAASASLPEPHAKAAAMVATVSLPPAMSTSIADPTGPAKPRDQAPFAPPRTASSPPETRDVYESGAPAQTPTSQAPTNPSPSSDASETTKKSHPILTPRKR